MARQVVFLRACQCDARYLHLVQQSFKMVFPVQTKLLYSTHLFYESLSLLLAVKNQVLLPQYTHGAGHDENSDSENGTIRLLDSG